MKIIERSFVARLQDAVKHHGDLIHVLIGPRQVGKTTGVRQLLSTFDGQSVSYCTADGEISRGAHWLEEQWILAESRASTRLLVVDEIQKVENWAEAVKTRWDAQASKKRRLKIILLGSSSLQIQKGLSESLAGRFLLHPVYHWDHLESKAAAGLTFDDFLAIGGYPGSYAFRADRLAWLHYVKHSIIEPVIAKDILSVARVKSPALFKQCFDLVCCYGGQEISYTKLLGQLQDKGNTDLVKSYLELFEGAFLIRQLFKYSNKKVLSRSSSPKILPLCPALYSVGLDGILDAADRGRAFEIAVGVALNQLPGELYYWREENAEVDFVYRFGKRLCAIEVKSGRRKSALGLGVFQKRFPASESFIVTPENMVSVLVSLATDR